jgi:hypothetical protein
MPRIQGFLYGHYDSRGGASFYETATKEEADQIYKTSFVLDADEAEEYGQQIADEDFLGTAAIESDTDVQDEEDIEYRDEGDERKLWVREDKNSETSHYELRIAKDQPPGFGESELGEDAFGVLVFRPSLRQPG